MALVMFLGVLVIGFLLIGVCDGLDKIRRAIEKLK